MRDGLAAVETSRSAFSTVFYFGLTWVLTQTILFGASVIRVRLSV